MSVNTELKIQAEQQNCLAFTACGSTN